MKTSPGGQPPIQQEEITARAREIWQKSGSPDGRDLEFWLAAEQELQRDRRDVTLEQHGDATPPRSTPSGGESQRAVTTSAPAPAGRRTRRAASAG